MSTLPILTAGFGVIAVILHFAGLEALVFIPMGLAVLSGMTGLVMGDRNKPASSRIACVMGIALALTPLAAPLVKEQRLRFMEKRRARETAPLYQQLDASVAAVTPLIRQYRETHSVWPDMSVDVMLPHIDATGALRQMAPMQGLAAPRDPFSRVDFLRWAAIRDTGVILASVGQDGVVELPLPGVAMDGAPSHPLAVWAATGVDVARRTYDPTNGALSVGDIVLFVGNEGVTRDQALGPLHQAWALAESRSPYRPTVLGRGEIDQNPQSRRDSEAAAQLLAEGQHLAALALASRGINERTPFTAQWKEPEYALDRTRGLALYSLGAWREAADSLNTFTRAATNDVVAHYYLAAALFRGGNRTAAITHLTAASQISNEPLADQAAARLAEIQRGRQPNFPPPAGLPQAAAGGATPAP